MRCVRNNAIVYNLIHCTGHIKGFQLYKTTEWQTFGGKSSTKNTHGAENQLMLDFDGGATTTMTDEYCYYVQDIAEYLQNCFAGQTVTLDKIWTVLDEHPVFPADGFKNEIKKELKTRYGAKENRSSHSMTFLSKSKLL